MSDKPTQPPAQADSGKLFNLYSQDGRKLTSAPLRESEVEERKKVLTESAGQGPIQVKEVLLG